MGEYPPAGLYSMIRVNCIDVQWTLEGQDQGGQGQAFTACFIIMSSFVHFQISELNDVSLRPVLLIWLSFRLLNCLASFYKSLFSLLLLL